MTLPVFFSPGRFFAANLLKCILAFLVLNYDFKLASDSGEGAYPPNIHIREHVFADPTVKVLFRKRQPVEVAA